MMRHPMTWTRGEEDGGKDNLGTVVVDNEDNGSVMISWDIGGLEQYPWEPHGSSEIVHVAFCKVAPSTGSVMETTGLPSNLATLLLKRNRGSCDGAVGQFFDGVDEAALAAQYLAEFPLRLNWRARVLPDAERVQALVEAHPELQWSEVRNDNIGRECWVMRLDASDQTAQVEHYDGSSSWYPQATLHRVIDPETEAVDPPRFAVGTLVECNMGEAGYLPGVVDSVWARSRGWKRRPTAVYSVKLDNIDSTDGNDMVTAPYDRDNTIRAQ